MPEEKSSTDLAVVRPQTQSTSIARQETFAPRNLADAMKFAEILASSGMVPKDYAGKPGAIVVAIQMGMEVGLQPMQAIQCIAVINGRPAIWGDGALALVKTHPEFEWIKEDDLDTVRKNSAAKCIIKRRSQPEVVMTFTMEDAKKAGLQGKQGPWSTYPNRMLQMRARGFAIRDAFPDALKGIITAEEAQDIPPIVGEGGVNYDQRPPAESKPDPNEEPITRVEATELWTTIRIAYADAYPESKLPENKEQAVAALKAVYQHGLKSIGGVDRSDHLLRKHLAAVKAYCEKPPQHPPAENPDAEPVEGEAGEQQG